MCVCECDWDEKSGTCVICDLGGEDESSVSLGPVFLRLSFVHLHVPAACEERLVLERMKEFARELETPPAETTPTSSLFLLSGGHTHTHTRLKHPEPSKPEKVPGWGAAASGAFLPVPPGRCGSRATSPSSRD